MMVKEGLVKDHLNQSERRKGSEITGSHNQYSLCSFDKRNVSRKANRGKIWVANNNSETSSNPDEPSK
jgi:hypothetical protein